MASYGIPSAGKTLSASVNSDTIKLAIGQTAEASSTNVYGLAGNDVISFAALGATGQLQPMVVSLSRSPLVFPVHQLMPFPVQPSFLVVL